MTHGWLVLVFAVEIVGIGILLLVLPRITRRGLLFGVYVGEEPSGADEARGIRRGWTLRISIVTVAAVAALVGQSAVSEPAIADLSAILILFTGLTWAYLRAHFAARRMAVPSSAPAVAVLGPEPSASAALVPLLTLGVVLAAGAALYAYVGLHLGEIPDRIPVHFNFAGNPDRWAARSVVQLFMLPTLAWFMGSFLALLAWMIAEAKRSVRFTEDPASADAQQRFRLATSRFLCGIALLVTGLFATMCLQQIHVARGTEFHFGAWMLVFGAGMTVYTLAGVAYLLVRYGQGGARLEKSSAGAALTDGLADNSCWKLGVFYVNREDPSFIVEKRFGLGYTINFGNPKAVALLAGFLLGLAALLVVAVVTAA